MVIKLGNELGRKIILTPTKIIFHNFYGTFLVCNRMNSLCFKTMSKKNFPKYGIYMSNVHEGIPLIPTLTFTYYVVLYMWSLNQTNENIFNDLFSFFTICFMHLDFVQDSEARKIITVKHIP